MKGGTERGEELKGRTERMGELKGWGNWKREELKEGGTERRK